MAEVAHPAVAERTREVAKDEAALAFPELVYAHFAWRKAVADGHVAPEAEQRYRRALARFEAQHGQIVNSYWCSEVESAVALTAQRVGPFPRLRSPKFSFHRLTDWVTKDEPDIAGKLHRLDELAVRASSVLTGLRRQICMQLVLASSGHLLSLVDARARHDDPVMTAKALVDEEERLDHIDEYFDSAANGQAQIMYFAGMAGLAGAIGSVAAGLWLAVGQRGLFAGLIAGSLGALISVLQRIDDRSFVLEHDVGRKYVVFLGGLRPLLGAAFGLAVYLAFKSQLISLKLPGDPGVKGADARFYALVVLSFVAGFNERWAQDTLAAATGSGRGKDQQKANGAPRRGEARARRQPDG
jgi:hypothetical protein